MFSETLALLIPILSIVMGLSLAMLSVYLSARRKQEALRMAHAERMAAIEKGLLPPPSQQFEPVEDYGSLLQRQLANQRSAGLIMVFVGGAITLAMWQTDNSEFWWGLVPVAIGVAQLLGTLSFVRPEPPAGASRPRSTAV